MGRPGLAIWLKNPKLAALPRRRSRPRPGVAVTTQRRHPGAENNYVLPDMVATALSGMPTKHAIEWAQSQVVQALRGQLKLG